MLALRLLRLCVKSLLRSLASLVERGIDGHALLRAKRRAYCARSAIVALRGGWCQAKPVRRASSARPSSILENSPVGAFMRHKDVSWQARCQGPSTRLTPPTSRVARIKRLCGDLPDSMRHDGSLFLDDFDEIGEVRARACEMVRSAIRLGLDSSAPIAPIPCRSRSRPLRSQPFLVDFSK